MISPSPDCKLQSAFVNSALSARVVARPTSADQLLRRGSPQPCRQPRSPQPCRRPCSPRRRLNHDESGHAASFDAICVVSPDQEQRRGRLRSAGVDRKSSVSRSEPNRPAKHLNLNCQLRVHENLICELEVR